jgi:lipoate-protein ligase A
MLLQDSPKQPWRLLTESRTEPRNNLARDEAIGRDPGLIPTIRLWRNDRCVVLGRFQVASAEVNQLVTDELGIPIYRRFTGGGAVYHDLGNLNITIVIPLRHPLFSLFPSRTHLPDLYAIVLEPLAAAVKRLGVEAKVTAREILVKDQKVSGVAAWLGLQKVLVHATLLIDSDLGVLDRVLNGPGAPGSLRWARTRSRRVPVTSLSDSGLSPANMGRIEVEIVSAFDNVASQGVQAGHITASEIVLEQNLLKRRYADLQWHTFGESPDLLPTPLTRGVAPIDHDWSHTCGREH